MNQFLRDVLKGLQATQKYLDSKYFYDKRGDELFQKIMSSDEYYLTNCEMEIFVEKKAEIADSVLGNTAHLDVIEFGPGDAVKSSHLLKELLNRNAVATYFPIDISRNIIELLNDKLAIQFPHLTIHGLNGEYLQMLSESYAFSKNKKLILFLGANIGNFKFYEMPEFCKNLNGLLSKDDLILIGFDLKKNPDKILAAYNDKEGFTTNFNLNLLRRINRELNADFNINAFEHYATYDPDSGACKSFLVSVTDQEVTIGETLIHFKKDETIFMEISQKYSLAQIDKIALECGFSPVNYFFDENKYFVDVLWKCR
ncbi:MAG: L-histidine N(alpha)-methyltransferase [Ginsengibacter sp.]